MITLVTLTYNNFDELMTTIESLQGVKGIVHYIVNGGTCSKTRDFLTTYSGGSISEPDNGIADAFNKGVKGTNTNYVAFLNSGDVLSDKTYFEKALTILESKPKIDFVHCKVKLNHPTYGTIIQQPRGRLP